MVTLPQVLIVMFLSIKISDSLTPESFCDHSFDGKCLLFNPSAKVSFDDAIKICSSIGFTVLSIKSKEENEIIKRMLGSSESWLNSKQGIFRSYKWLDDHSFLEYHNWFMMHPKCRKSCCALYMRGPDGFWRDDDCDSLKGVVCQKMRHADDDDPHDDFRTTHDKIEREDDVPQPLASSVTEVEPDQDSRDSNLLPSLTTLDVTNTTFINRTSDVIPKEVKDATTGDIFLIKIRQLTSELSEKMSRAVGPYLSIGLLVIVAFCFLPYLIILCMFIRVKKYFKNIKSIIQSR